MSKCPIKEGKAFIPARRTEDPLNDDLCKILSNEETTKTRQRAIDNEEWFNKPPRRRYPKSDEDSLIEKILNSPGVRNYRKPHVYVPPESSPSSQTTAERQGSRAAISSQTPSGPSPDPRDGHHIPRRFGKSAQMKAAVSHLQQYNNTPSRVGEQVPRDRYGAERSRIEDQCYYARPAFDFTPLENCYQASIKRIYEERDPNPSRPAHYYDASSGKRRSRFNDTQDESSSRTLPSEATKAPAMNLAGENYVDNTDDCGISDAFKYLKIEDKVEPLFCSETKTTLTNERRNLGHVSLSQLEVSSHNQRPNIFPDVTEKEIPSPFTSLETSEQFLEGTLNQNTVFLEEAVDKTGDKESETPAESADVDGGSHSFVSINLEDEDGDDVEDEGWVRI